MSISFTYKSKQFFWLIIKLLIVIGCVFFIYQKIFLNDNLQFSFFKESIINSVILQPKHLSIVFFFSLLNWFLEIYKWKELTSLCKKTTLKESAIQSLASLTTSLITPNRIGEYGAKALYFDNRFRKKIVLLNFIGNSYQLLATLIFGSIGFFLLTLKFDFFTNFNTVLKNLFVFIAITVVTLIVLKKIKITIFIKAKQFFKEIPLKLNLKTGFIAILRFLVFSHQFYFLLQLFSIDVGYSNAFMGICSMYLISSLVPMLSLLDVVVKGSVAVFIFTFFNFAPILILSVVTIMWIFNFAIPALIGSYFVITFKPKIAA